MMNVLSWLYPEVITSEVMYGIGPSDALDSCKCCEIRNSGSRNCSKFDATGFYEAIKPSKEEAIFENDLPDLLFCLRPCQQPAVYWTVTREKGTSDDKFKMFYNPFNENISWRPLQSSYVSSGILADEMGLGKSVELLACIFANHKQSSEGCITDHESEEIGSQIRRQRRERVECICNAASESQKYEGL